MEEFIPTTYRMDVRAEREAFFAHQEGKMHISSTLTSNAFWRNNDTAPVQLDLCLVSGLQFKIR